MITNGQTGLNGQNGRREPVSPFQPFPQVTEWTTGLRSRNPKNSYNSRAAALAAAPRLPPGPCRSMDRGAPPDLGMWESMFHLEVILLHLVRIPLLLLENLWNSLVFGQRPAGGACTKLSKWSKWSKWLKWSQMVPFSSKMVHAAYHFACRKRLQGSIQNGHKWSQMVKMVTNGTILTISLENGTISLRNGTIYAENGTIF